MTRVNWPAQQLVLSKLAFGCAPVMGRIGRRQALNAMAAAFDAGVTHFDVARSYGFGDAERVVGRFISGRRGAVTVATKFGIRPQPLTLSRRLARPVVRIVRGLVPLARKAVRRGAATMLAAGHYSLAEARASLDTSLRELGTDTVDLLLVHECTRAAPVRGDVIAWLRDLRAQGKIRAWGFATGGDEADHYRAGYPHADAVLQRELRPHDLAEPAAGVICHSPFALLPGVAASSGLARRRLETFALTHDLRAADLPLLLLEAALHASPDCVILCSMFQPRHLQANTQCLARPRFAPALRAEFMRLVMEMQGLEDAINGHRPDRTLQTMEQSQ